MALKRHRHHHHRRISLSFAITAAAITTFLLLNSVSAITPNRPHPFREEEMKGGGNRWEAMNYGIWSRRILIGPGSSPPTCRSKCGRCAPCKPVHVPIQPGVSIPLEYYPEAWRCRCGNKLFMP